MSSAITIRRANLNDLECIVRANAAMALETESKMLDESALQAGVLAALENPALGFYLLAEMDGQAVGQLLITAEWSDWRNACFWWIQSVYVAPEFRQRGVYRALHQRALQAATAEGNICGIRLYVERTNHLAQQVYVNLGMRLSHYDMYELEFGN